MSLFQFELKKLLINKKTIITLSALFIVYAFVGFVLCSLPLGGKTNYDIYSRQVEQQIHTNNPELAAVSTEAYADAKVKYGDDDDVIDDVAKFIPDLMFNINYARYIQHVDEYYNGSPKDAYDIPYGINVLEANIAKMEADGDTTSFAHNKLVNQLSIEKSVGEPVYANTALWEKLFGTWGNVIVVIMLFMPLAYFIVPVFSMEASTGMDNLILSSINGRKKIVTAKLAAVLVTSVVVVMMYCLATFLANFLSLGSFVGWDAALRSVTTYLRSPIGASIWQYALVSAVWMVFCGGFLGVLYAFISSKINNSIAAFGVALGAIFGSLLLSDFSGLFPTALHSILKFVPSDMAQLSKVFGAYSVFNVFGMVVPYYVIAPVVIVILTGIMIFAIYHFQKKRRMT